MNPSVHYLLWGWVDDDGELLIPRPFEEELEHADLLNYDESVSDALKKGFIRFFIERDPLNGLPTLYLEFYQENRTEREIKTRLKQAVKKIENYIIQNRKTMPQWYVLDLVGKGGGINIIQNRSFNNILRAIPQHISESVYPVYAWGWVTPTGGLLLPDFEKHTAHEDMFPNDNILNILKKGYVRWILEGERLSLEFMMPDPKSLIINRFNTAVSAIEEGMFSGEIASHFGTTESLLFTRIFLDIDIEDKPPIVVSGTPTKIRNFLREILMILENINTKKGKNMNKKNLQEAPNDIFKMLQKMMSGEAGDAINQLLGDEEALSNVINHLPVDKDTKNAFKALVGKADDVEGDEPEDYFNDDYETPWEKENYVYGWITKKGTVLFGSGESPSDITMKHLKTASEAAAFERNWIEFEFSKHENTLTFKFGKDYLTLYNDPRIIEALSLVLSKAKKRGAPNPRSIVAKFSFDKTLGEFQQEHQFSTILDLQQEILNKKIKSEITEASKKRKLRDMYERYGIWGWIDDKGELILPKKINGKMQTHNEMSRELLGVDWLAAIKRGWIRVMYEPDAYFYIDMYDFPSAYHDRKDKIIASLRKIEDELIRTEARVPLPNKVLIAYGHDETRPEGGAYQKYLEGGIPAAMRWFSGATTSITEKYKNYKFW